MVSVARRIEALEGRCVMDEGREAKQRRTEEKRELAIAHLTRVMGRVEQEELESPSEPSRRRAALEELQERIERRRRGV